MSFVIDSSTPFILLQDKGRFGCRPLGVTQGGALDWVSMGWANWLLGNHLDAAVVEVGLGAFSLPGATLHLVPTVQEAAHEEHRKALADWWG